MTHPTQPYPTQPNQPKPQERREKKDQNHSRESSNRDRKKTQVPYRTVPSATAAWKTPTLLNPTQTLAQSTNQPTSQPTNRARPPRPLRSHLPKNPPNSHRAATLRYTTLRHVPARPTERFKRQNWFVSAWWDCRHDLPTLLPRTRRACLRA